MKWMVHHWVVATFTLIVWILPSTLQAASVVFVTTTNDDVDGDTTDIDALNADPGGDTLISLREAMLAISSGGFGNIRFDATVFPPTAQAVITVTNSALPTITSSSAIHTISNLAGVTIDGTGLPAGTDGFTITGTGVSIRGLTIRNFPGDGIQIDGAGSCTIGASLATNGNVIINNGDNGIESTSSGTVTVVGNFIGTNHAFADCGNAGHGIYLNGTGSVVVGGDINLSRYRNHIAFHDGAGDAGIYINNGSATIYGNYIGTNSAGANLGNAYGILLAAGADDATIGSSTHGEGNVIGQSDSYQIYYQASSGTQTIKGNSIGTTYDTATWRDLAPQSHGIYVDGAGTLTIGGLCTGSENSASVISRIFEGNFISFHDTANMAGVYVNNGAPTILGNYIGTNRAGGDLGNLYGIQLAAGADNVTIGGSTYGQGNTIGRSDSVGIYYEASSGTQVIKGNYIGTTYDAGTWRDLATVFYGIYVNGAGGLTIGGTCTGATQGTTSINEGNYICFHDTGGNGYGIYISDGSPSILGNYIGTNRAGADLGNYFGIYFAVAADNVTIGSSTHGQGNTIGQSDSYQIYYQASGGTQTIKGNSIGTTYDAGAWLNLAPQSHGIYVDGAGSLTIGGLCTGSENSASVISRIFEGNFISYHDTATMAGIYVNDGAPTVLGNYIGTNRAGNDLGNAYGIQLAANSDNTTIGSSTHGQGNTIGQSDNYQIYYQASGGTQTIKGNYIGTTYDASTWRDLAPQSHGVYVDGAGTLTLGGTSTGSGNSATVLSRIFEGNFISFHDTASMAGVYVNNGAPTILGNYIGTNRAGSDLGNVYGIQLAAGADNVTIGGSTYGQGNTIGRSDSYGIYYLASSGTQVIKGNFIGTTFDAGTWRDLAHVEHGVYVNGAGTLTIGGVCTGGTGPQNIYEGNYISFHNTASKAGIYVNDGAPTILGNYIGTNRAGNDLGNVYGIQLAAGADNVTIGGNTYGQGNTIGQNDSVGIYYLASSGTQVIKGNYIGTTYDAGTWRDLASVNYGIYVTGAGGLTIGGTSTGATQGTTTINEGNYICFHDTAANGNGIYINDGAPTILGNYLGTNRAGDDLGNYIGINFAAGADNATVGSSTYGQGNTIGQSDLYGIQYSASTGTQTIKGNSIGTTYDAGTWRNLAPQSHGIYVNGAGGLTIGGLCTGSGNSATVISRIFEGNFINYHDTATMAGIYVNDGAPTILGNYIGTNRAGEDHGNVYGILLAAGADNVTIGGSTYGQGNTIGRSDSYGIYFQASSGTQVIKGNFIGTTYDAGTWRDLAHVEHGIYVDGAGALTIGGVCTGSANSASVISRIFEGNFISYHNTAAKAGIYVNNGAPTILGNYLGTNRMGNDLGNVYGILLAAGADNVTIGGSTYGQGNTIGQSDSYGIYFQASSGTQVIKGNFIGTTYDAGTWRDLAHVEHGIYVDGAGALTIGGVCTGGTGPQNIYEGNHICFHNTAAKAGIYVNDEGPTIKGNYIGSNRAGTDLGNYYGVYYAAGTDNSVLGGAAYGEGNFIGGSDNNSIHYLASSGSQTIKGNFIGVTYDAGAWRELTSPLYGILANGAGTLTIGGVCTGAAHPISINEGNYITNSGYGIYIVNGSHTIKGNYIGTNRSGTDMGNSYGMVADNGADNLTIGGSTYGEGNVFGFSTFTHLFLYPSSGTQTVKGCFVGTTYDAGVWRDVNGVATNGIFVDGTFGGTGVTLGGSTSAEANHVCFADDNGSIGVYLYETTCVVMGNYVGTNANGNDLHNDYGLYCENGTLTLGDATQRLRVRAPSTKALYVPGATTTVINLSGLTEIEGSVDVNAGTFNMNSASLIVSGNVDPTGATFSIGTNSCITLDGAAAQTLTGITAFQKLHYAGTSRYNLPAASAIDDELVVESGAVSCPGVTVTFSDGATIKVGRGASSKGVLTLDNAIFTSEAPGIDLYVMSIEPGGDIHARRSQIISLGTTGLVFKSGSRMGSQTPSSSGLKNFASVTFDKVQNAGYGMDLSGLVAGDDPSIPNTLNEIRFKKNAGTPFNVKAAAGTPAINFILQTGNFGDVAADGESGDDDASNRITWTTGSTWVSLSDFRAEGDIPADLIKVLWQTEAEFGNLGFHVYRSQDRHGPFVRLTDSLLAPPVTLDASLTGYSYRYDDPVPRKGELWYYQIEDFDAEGHRAMHGPVCVDWDADGLPDDWELANGFDNLNPSDAPGDSDADGISNLDEYRLGLDPRSGDSDGDGVQDGQETRTRWDGPVIQGINAGGEGLTVIGQDPFGMTLELDCSGLKIDPITREYAGWINDSSSVGAHGHPAGVSEAHAPSLESGLFRHRWKPLDLVTLSYSNMPTEWTQSLGHARIPVKRVLLNVPRGRKIAIRPLIEQWGQDRVLTRPVEPVPDSVDRPESKTILKKVVKTTKRKVTKIVKKDITVLTGYQKRKQTWASLWGGESYRTEFVEEKRTLEEPETLEESFQEEVEELQKVAGTKMVEVYGLKRSAYAGVEDAPVGHFSAGQRSAVGGQDAVLLTIHNVKYAPMAHRIRHLSRLRFRVDYVWDPSSLKESVAAWRATYDAAYAAKPAYLDAVEAYEIKVRKPAYSDVGSLHDAGLFKVTFTNLQTAGMDIAGIQADPTKLRLYQGAVELSLKSVADGFIFFVDAGQNETLYSDRVTLYALEGSSGSGKRWGAVANEPGFDRELTEFTQRVRHESNNSYNYMESSPDTLFVNSLSSFGAQLRSYTFQTPGISPAGPVDLRVRMYGGFDQDPDIDQGAYLTMNAEGAPYASPSWGGLRWHTQASTLDSSRLIDGVNTLKLTGYIPAGITQTRVRLDHIEVGYPRRLVSKSEKLLIDTALESGVTKMAASGFADSSLIGVYDVTDAGDIREITGATRAVGTVSVNVRPSVLGDAVIIPDFLRLDSDLGFDDISGRSNLGYGIQTAAPYMLEGLGVDPWTGLSSVGADLRVRPRGIYEGSYARVAGGLHHVGSRILFADLSSARAVESVKKVVKTDIRGRRTPVDHLIVVDESMKSSAQRLVDALHGESLEDFASVSSDVGAHGNAPVSHGQVVEMVTFQDLCKEYTQGEYSSSAIHDYVKERWRTAYVKPRFLTLIGTGNINTKAVFNFPLRPALIPSVVLRGGVKAAASDGVFGLITEDAYPDLAVGRLDASNVSELESIIDKVLAYRDNEPPAQKKALMLGDHDPSYYSAVFTEHLDRMTTSFESDWIYEKAYRTQVGASDLSAKLSTELNASRVNLLVYNGHGNFQDWGLDLFWRVSSMPQLGVGHWTPVILESNCMSADFFHVAQKCLDSAWLTAVRSGAVAVIGTTGRTSPTAKQEALASTLDHLLRRGFPRVGDALLRGRIDALARDPADRVRAILSMTLLGVPSMGLR